MVLYDIKLYHIYRHIYLYIYLYTYELYVWCACMYLCVCVCVCVQAHTLINVNFIIAHNEAYKSARIDLHAYCIRRMLHVV